MKFMKILDWRFNVENAIEDVRIAELLTAAQRSKLCTALSILKDFRAVFLCEPVGTGKTYVSCALASVWRTRMGGKCAVIAPAHLLEYWQRVMRIFEVDCEYYSYQKSSLGGLPKDSNERLWIIDEAHYLKNVKTKRYQACFERTRADYVCLLTATPVSISWNDLSAIAGVCGASDNERGRLFAAAVSTASVGQGLQIEKRIQREEVTIKYEICQDRDRMDEAVNSWEMLDWISPRDDGRCADAGIVRQVLMHRMLSHRASCLATLIKLEKYCRSCRIGGGQVLTRKSLMHLMGPDGVQALIPFEDVAYGPTVSETDNARLNKLLTDVEAAAAAVKSICEGPDGKCEALQRYIDALNGAQAVMFTQYAETAKYLGKHLKAQGIAVVTSAGAMLNGKRIDLDLIEAMFDPGRDMPEWWKRASWGRAQVLICTDALSCGHNFHRAHCAVHIDLPWNPTTVHQREGRIVRKGQAESRVYIAQMTALDMCDVLNQYQNKLSERMKMRSQMQKTWKNCGKLAANDYMIVPCRGIPGLWARCGGEIFPIPCDAVPKELLGRMVSDVSFVSAFEGGMIKNPVLSEMWRTIRNHKNRCNMEKYMRIFLLFALLSSSLPKHHAAALRRIGVNEEYIQAHPECFLDVLIKYESVCPISFQLRCYRLHAE